MTITEWTTQAEEAACASPAMSERVATGANRSVCGSEEKKKIGTCHGRFTQTMRKRN